MGLFDVFNNLRKSADKALNPEYAKNKDFLEAACALCASVAAADGNIEESERDATVTILTTHPKLGTLYSTQEIKSCAETMFSRAVTNMGRLSLQRELDDIKGKGQDMAQDVYMIALDVAGADGNVGEDEEKVLERFATRLGVDVRSLGL